MCEGGREGGKQYLRGESNQHCKYRQHLLILFQDLYHRTKHRHVIWSSEKGVGRGVGLYQVKLIGLGLKVLFGSLNEDNDIGKGTNCVLEGGKRYDRQG